MPVWRIVIGWVAVAISTIVASFWAFWGILENFHEGWFYQSLIKNIGLMVVQYLSFSILFVATGLISIRFPNIGAALHICLAIFVGVFFLKLSFSSLLISGFLAFLGIMYWYGRPVPSRIAYLIVIVVPLLVLVGFGIGPLIRVAGRLNDGNFGTRMIEANGVRLTWAPEGPGFPNKPVSWEDASRICTYLSEDGKSLASTPQNIWRLPTVEESVKSQCRYGSNAGGVWNERLRRASYAVRPDKESPLWNPQSMIIYYWTSTAIDERSAYIICYDGKVWPKRKTFGLAAFRAVRPR